ncbi:MAG: hypothetical protein NTU44_02185 [Bacteroidetes bacterium]|nr:hypothetical protein [Bacteroidota bacterium]
MAVKSGSIVNYLFAALSLTFGIIYLTRNSFMPYHSLALSLEWRQVEPNTQFLILALMRAVSGGFIVSAIAIGFLQFQFTRTKISWIPPLILAIGVVIEATTLYATLIVRLNTPGNPPLWLAIFALILVVAGFILNRKSLLDISK